MLLFSAVNPSPIQKQDAIDKLQGRVKSGNFGHQVNLDCGNPDEAAPSHKDFHCLLSYFIIQLLKYETNTVAV